MDKTKAAKNQKLFGIAAVAFLSIGIVHVGYKALEISAHEEWGMPWYFAIFSPGLVYVFPLIVCIVAYFFFSKELKKKTKNNKDHLKMAFIFYSNITVTALAPCAPMTSACSISAVFEGPEMKQPYPKSSKAGCL